MWGAGKTWVLILWKKEVRAIRGYGQRRPFGEGALWGLQRDRL